MSLTVTEMQTYVGQLLTDTGNVKFTVANHILPALKSAQEEFVMHILAFRSQNPAAVEMLSELHETHTQNIGTTGYALSGLDATKRFMRHGFIAAKGTIDGEERWYQEISPADLNLQHNIYSQGNDERPLCYIFKETFYVLASMGSYPISTTIYFVREPKELIASGASGYQVTTCELNGQYHRFICEMAAANCWRMLGDPLSMQKYQKFNESVVRRIQSLAVGGVEAPRLIEEEN